MACRRRVRSSSVPVVSAVLACAVPGCGVPSPLGSETSNRETVAARVHAAGPSRAASILRGQPVAELSAPPPPEARAARSSAAFLIEDTNASAISVIPPQEQPSRVVVTMLHGMCGAGEEVCPAVSSGLPTALFVCPSGNGRCSHGADWIGTPQERAEFVLGRLELVAREPSLPVPKDGQILMGFSRGAFTARDIAYTTSGIFSALVLIGAAIVPDAERLRQNGFRRVVLAAGEHDGALRTMRRGYAALCAAGMPTRLVSLGPVWHALPSDSGARLRDSLEWASSAVADESDRPCESPARRRTATVQPKPDGSNGS